MNATDATTFFISYGSGPIVHFASEEVKQRFLPDLLTGRKRIALAITEPKAGSNVANVSTTAELSPDGKEYIVNGTKKVNRLPERYGDVPGFKCSLQMSTVDHERDIFGCLDNFA